MSYINLWWKLLFYVKETEVNPLLYVFIGGGGHACDINNEGHALWILIFTSFFTAAIKNHGTRRSRDTPPI